MSRITIKNILANLVAFIIFFNLLSLFIYSLGDAMPILWWLVLPFFLMQVVRAKASNAYVFAILHIALTACVWLVLGNWFAVVFMLAATVYSFIVKGSGEWELTRKTGIIVLVSHIAMFIFAQRWAESDPFLQQLAGTSIVALSLIILCSHMDNIDASLRMLQHPDKDRHSSGRVLRTNNILIIVFTAIVVLIGFVIAALPVGRVLASGWEAVRGGVSSFFARFERQRPQFDFAEYTSVERVAQVDADGFIFVSQESLYFGYLPDEGMATDEIGRVTTIDQYILFGAVIIGIVIVIYNFIRYFVNASLRKNKTKSGSDEKTSLTRDILSDIRDLLPRFGRYSKNAIRRAYTRKVNWHIRRGVSIKRSDTTDIIANKIRNKEDIDELTAMYEQVRYFS